jgi:hypothetical protein
MPPAKEQRQGEDEGEGASHSSRFSSEPEVDICGQIWRRREKGTLGTFVNSDEPPQALVAFSKE